MAEFRHIFKRCELKYRLNDAQYRAIATAIAPYMREDEYGRSTICNLYLDTPDHRIIRQSLDKPSYKEKLRLRCYGIPTDDSTAFVELKKKYQGTVYKRRIAMTYAEAIRWLSGGPPPRDEQIAREVDWFRKVYGNVLPAMVIISERVALFAKDDPELRITFDENIRYREKDLDLRNGADGIALQEPGERLMEIKVADAMPLWLTRLLDEQQLYPMGYSKYGLAYQRTCGVIITKGDIYCA